MNELWDPFRPDENMKVCKVTNLWIYQSRYRNEVEEVRAGNWVLIEGIDSIISKTATIVEPTNPDKIYPLTPIDFRQEPIIRVACESVLPS